ncbi:MAG: DUF1934 domain-containing protein [Lachnospiraceae bacterium]|nr:DUF1934 domain-containing protein [Lachnospiraceae bacterium]
MEKEVLITINGTHTDPDNITDTVSLKVSGQYFVRGEFTYLIYEEKVDESDEIIKSMIKLHDDCAVVTKRGAVDSSMVYKLGEDTFNHYATPYGVLKMDIHTDEIMIIETEDRIDITIEYYMATKGSRITTCSMEIVVTPL